MANLVFNFLLVGVPLLILGFWVFVTEIILKLSDWRVLERAFPMIDEEPKIILRMGSGRLGSVAMNNSLTLSLGAAGLQVSMWKLFRPFSHPFTIPWGEIHVTEGMEDFGEVARLGFGSPELGALSLDKTTWEKLAAYAPDSR